jgi:hypothetical protein
MLDPEHTESGKKGKYFISFPDGTTGTFTTWKAAMEEMKARREN